MPDVLLVDDDPNVCSVVSTLLARAGLQVQAAMSPARAVTAALARWPNVVLLDLTLGGQRDGWELWEQLEALSQGRPLKVIVFAAEVSGDDLEAAWRRGATGLLRKTATPQQVVECVRQACFAD